MLRAVRDGDGARLSILVVGGAGYIGGHTCKALAAAGYQPVVLDDLSLGHERFVQWGPLVRGDVRDPAVVRDAIRKHGAVAAMHFAAFAYVGESVVDPGKYYANNVGGMIALLQGMQDTACDSLIFSSTCSVYGELDRPSIPEDSPLNPVNPYGRSKLMCEQIMRDFQSAHGMRTTALRYFNAAGADPDGALGELRDPETHLIPRALMSLQGHVRDFAVFGSDFPTPDGTAIRDYIHVSDVAEAHVQALRRLLSGAPGGDVYNLGTGTGHSVAEVLDAIRRVTGRALPEARGPRRSGDPAKLVADPRLARKELGFVASRSSLDNIIETAWRWHQKTHPVLDDVHDVGEGAPRQDRQKDGAVA